MEKTAISCFLILMMTSFSTNPALCDELSEIDLSDFSLEQLLDVEVVSISRKPEGLQGAAAAVFVITAEDIKRSGAHSIPEALQLAPGLNVARIVTKSENGDTANDTWGERMIRFRGDYDFGSRDNLSFAGSYFHGDFDSEFQNITPAPPYSEIKATRSQSHNYSFQSTWTPDESTTWNSMTGQQGLVLFGFREQGIWIYAGTSKILLKVISYCSAKIVICPISVNSSAGSVGVEKDNRDGTIAVFFHTQCLLTPLVKVI